MRTIPSEQPAASKVPSALNATLRLLASAPRCWDLSVSTSWAEVVSHNLVDPSWLQVARRRLSGLKAACQIAPECPCSETEDAADPICHRRASPARSLLTGYPLTLAMSFPSGEKATPNTAF